MSGSRLEESFVSYWGLFGKSELVREHKFAPPRRWRFDFAHLGAKVAVEIEGGVYSGGRHTRGKGFEGDIEKYNAATLEGWAVLRFTSTMLKKDPQGCIEQVNELIAEREN